MDSSFQMIPWAMGLLASKPLESCFSTLYLSKTDNLAANNSPNFYQTVILDRYKSPTLWVLKLSTLEEETLAAVLLLKSSMRPVSR